MSPEDKERYSRHLILPEIGESGQERLMRSRVLIVGAGGLASPIAMYLAASGIGTIGIADGDVVSLSNLQRQVIHFTADVGTPKVVSAADKIRAINPSCMVVVYDKYIDDASVDDIIKDYDFIIEATDNADSRYRINDACVRLGKPFCIGGVSHFGGQAMTCTPGSATYRDIFPNPVESVETPLPVLSPVVGILGTIMATETIKYLTGIGRLLTNRLLTFDALSMEFNTFDIESIKHL